MVGIESFVSENIDGFTGTIKTSPGDFIVQEIDEKGSVVAFDEETRLDLPQAPIQQPSAGQLPIRRAEKTREDLIQLIGRDQVDQLDKIDKEPMILSAPVARTEFYRAMKSCFPKLQATPSADKAFHMTIQIDPMYIKLKSYECLSEQQMIEILKFVRSGDLDSLVFETETDRNVRRKMHEAIQQTFRCLQTSSVEQKIVIRFSKKIQRKRKRTRTYLRFVLCKRGLEHNRAIDMIRSALKIPANLISFAGTKDKIGITFQHVVVPDVDPSVLLTKLNAISDRLSVGNVVYTDKPLRLGQANGNRFLITIRNVFEIGEKVIEKAIKTVEEHGFINYFGTQRVGDPSRPVRSHHIGLAMLQKDWSKAIDLIFAIQPNDSGDLVSAKQLFLQDRNLDQALKALPSTMLMEKNILNSLKRYSAQHALAQLPFAHTQLYIRAYQSLLFNQMASYRIQKYGLLPIQGDLIETPDGIRIISPEDEITSEMIRQVVLPLPGTQSIYPSNDVGVAFQDRIAADRIENWSNNGSYRKLIEFPQDLTWSYTSSSVVLDFKLLPGCYATICLREMMKI